MLSFFSPPSTPAKTSQRSVTTPLTEIRSPYDYDKQVDYELGETKKRKDGVMNDEIDIEATVITDRYSRPIFTKENDDLVEVTTKMRNGGPYFYENGESVPYQNMNRTNLFSDFNRIKKSRTTGGKSRKNRKTVKRRKTGKSKRKNKSAHKKRH